jgi:urea transporter
MPEPEPARPVMRRRLRYSVRTLMGIVVVLALILAVLSPLSPFGLPPCLTPVETVTWLVAKPATASCMDCHSRR